jgi:hypothetical protein
MFPLLSSPLAEQTQTSHSLPRGSSRATLTLAQGDDEHGGLSMELWACAWCGAAGASGAARAGLVLHVSMAGRARARAHVAWASVGQDEVPIDKLYVLQQHAEGWDLGWPHMELQAASFVTRRRCIHKVILQCKSNILSNCILRVYHGLCSQSVCYYPWLEYLDIL